jgi:hypothetical protein
MPGEATALYAQPFSGKKRLHRPNPKLLANPTYAFPLFTESGQQFRVRPFFTEKVEQHKEWRFGIFAIISES